MTETLKTLSNALADTVVSAAGSIVRVEARRRLPATGIVWSQDGLLLTASHVVRRDEGIQVGLPSGVTVAAKIVGRDPTTDVALLKVEQELTGVPAWQDPDDLKVGHLVLALGRPGGSVQATLGVLSALGSSWRTPAGGELTRYVQTDVVMYPGFSGGPLVSGMGEFVGMNTSGLIRGVSVAVPAASLGNIVGDLAAHGHVRRGYLGVSLQIVRLSSELQSDLNQKTGLLIAGIEEGSPASKSGVFHGDIIVGCADEKIEQLDDLFVQLTSERIGQSMPFKLVRAGEQIEVSVEVGARDAG